MYHTHVGTYLYAAVVAWLIFNKLDQTRVVCKSIKKIQTFFNFIYLTLHDRFKFRRVAFGETSHNILLFLHAVQLFIIIIRIVFICTNKILYTTYLQDFIHYDIVGSSQKSPRKKNDRNFAGFDEKILLLRSLFLRAPIYNLIERNLFDWQSKRFNVSTYIIYYILYLTAP